MKRLLCAAVAAVLVITAALSGCGKDQEPKQQQGPVQPTLPAAAAACDVDLTTLSSTMVYSEVYNMLAEPAKYMGKKIKMAGTFAVYQGEDKNYYACLISDATACCSQGIEFVLDGEYRFPEDYPELGTEITVTGYFDTYYEGEEMYCQLIHAELV